MGWAAFCGSNKTSLAILPTGKITVDSAEYVKNVLYPLLVPFWLDMCEKHGWTVVVEDNAPGHKGWSKAYRLREYIVDVIEWPPQSPDLNLIETCWDHVVEKLGKRFPFEHINSVTRLEALFKEEWDAITPEYLDSFIRTMPDRIQAVIAVKGGYTKY